MSQIAHEIMKDLDSLPKKGEGEGTNVCTTATTPSQRPHNALSTDVPATEEEIQTANEYVRKESDTYLDYLKKSCVWCSRNRGEEDRSVLEFLVRSQGIWLHAFQYSLKGLNGKQICYSTPVPDWCCL